LSPPAVERLSNSPISRVVLTNTLPLAPENYFPKVEVLSVAKILADALAAVFDETSVSELFDGENQS
jgi:ribose-phosphate pyrophosphokinase